MAIIRIEGVPPWDGDYPLDVAYFTNRELHLIKQIADVRAGELQDEFARGNNDLVVAIAVIASARNGKTIPVDDLWDAPAGKITLEEDAVEVEPIPPAVAPPTEELPSGATDGSGPGLNGGSDDPAKSLQAIGSRG